MAHLTMDEAKKSGKAGDTFTNPRGVTGTILPDLVNGKRAAVFNCSTPGCTNTHTRLVSDWHQVSRCKECSKKKAKVAKPKPVVVVDTEAAQKQADDLLAMMPTLKIEE